MSAQSDKLREILTATETAHREFLCAIRNRHYVACTSMYDSILRAEAAMLTLKEELVKAITKEEG